MKNAISIDLEDWFCVNNFRDIIPKDDWENCELRVRESTQNILKLLNNHNVKATFFVLGWIAERVPDLIKNIHAQGHEIATHGYSHSLITEMTPEKFKEDLSKAIKITEEIVETKIIGFRAPSFTIVNKTLWALDILNDCGIKYDSSVFPITFHPDYGMDDVELTPFQITKAIIEFPLTVAEVFGKKIPCSGGGYFRLYPYSITKYLLKQCLKQERPIIFYCHPWEVDPDQPKMKLPLMKKFRHYVNLSKTIDKLEKLLTDFEFTTVKEALEL